MSVLDGFDCKARDGEGRGLAAITGGAAVKVGAGDTAIAQK
jgi:hypothetical protein